jgi:hypothetical protein
MIADIEIPYSAFDRISEKYKKIVFFCRHFNFDTL